MGWVWEILRYVAAWGGTALLVLDVLQHRNVLSDRIPPRCPNPMTATPWHSNAVAA